MLVRSSVFWQSCDPEMPTSESQAMPNTLIEAWLAGLVAARGKTLVEFVPQKPYRQPAPTHATDVCGEYCFPCFLPPGALA